MPATPYGRTETADLATRVESLRSQLGRPIGAIDRLISEDRYQSAWVENTTLYGITVPIARSADARQQYETHPHVLEGIQNAFLAAGWDHVEYRRETGDLLLLIDPERAIEIELDDGSLVRDLPPEDKTPAEWASEQLNKPVMRPHDDGTWSLYPANRIRGIRWPASRANPLVIETPDSQ